VAPERAAGGLSAAGAAAIAGLGSLLSVVVIYPLNSAVIPALGNPAALLVTVPAEDLLTAIGLGYLVWAAPATLATKTAGVRLGAVAGLVFGVVETVLNGSGLLGILFSTPLHMAVSAIIGIGLVFAAGRRRGGRSDASVFLFRDTVSLVVIAIGCNFAYDALARSLGIVGVLAGLGLIGAVLAVIYRHLPEDLSPFVVSDPVTLLSAAFARAARQTRPAAAPMTAVPAPSAAAPAGTPAAATSLAARFCSACGTTLTAGYAFCPGCGGRIASEATR
jgi:hypothetical protein